MPGDGVREAVVIGAGLTGLAAAFTLERAGLTPTLIEVKKRAGGSIDTVRENDFVMDAGSMLHTIGDRPAFDAFLAEIGLDDALAETGDGRILFRDGTAALIDALDQRITGSRMIRMAVSTLGELDGRFSICMENGMLLDARALVVAVPARYAERLFYTLTPDISARLLDYRYDSIARVSLGYRLADVRSIATAPPPDYPVTFIDHTAASGRVPDGHVLIQAGIRYDPAARGYQDLAGEFTARMGWPQNPVVGHTGVWPEADPVMWRDPDHAVSMAALQALLPDGVALAGSDYIPAAHPPRLDERIAAGQAAAKRVLAHLGRV